MLEGDDADTNMFIDSFNTAVTELGKKRVTKKLWVTTGILRLCDQRRELKNFKYDSD